MLNTENKEDSMSYDLYFVHPDGRPLPAEDLESYFGGRPNYETKPGQAWYTNEDTGVCFSFEWRLPAETDEDPPEDEAGNVIPSVAEFNLNYFRSHVFALEAEKELALFVKRFGLKVYDPQVDGMGDGDYSSNGFFKGWNAGNEASYATLQKQDGRSGVTFTMAARQIEGYWRWNYEREALQEQMGDMIFVPRIVFLRVNGRALSALVWTDAIPIALPQTDYLVLLKNQLASRRLFGKKQELALAEWQAIAPILSPFPVHAGPVEYRLLQYSEAPASVVAFFRRQATYTGKLEWVPLDSIHDAEFVKQMLRGKS